MTEERIIELEIKVAYHEDLMLELNQIVSQQQRQIDRLELTCERLIEYVRSMQNNSNNGEQVDQTPPHY